jgi:hypothetical protein
VSSTYFDASAILRVVLDQEPALPDWDKIELGVPNEIVRVECLRTIERLRHEQKLTDEAAQIKRAAVTDFLRSLDLVMRQSYRRPRIPSSSPPTTSSSHAPHAP